MQAQMIPGEGMPPFHVWLARRNADREEARLREELLTFPMPQGEGVTLLLTRKLDETRFAPSPAIMLVASFCLFLSAFLA